MLRAAARAALRRGAAESGVAFLRRALDEPPPADQRAALLLETGLAEVMGSGADAVEHLRGALAALVDPPLRALAAAALGRALLFTGDAAGGRRRWPTASRTSCPRSSPTCAISCGRSRS